MNRNYRINFVFGNTLFTLFMISMYLACTPVSSRDQQKPDLVAESESTQRVIPGADQPGLYIPKLRGKRVGLVANQSSLVLDKHLLDTLLALDIDVRKIFVPEHGFRGEEADGAVIKDDVDVKTGLPIVSLYGSNKKPDPKQISDLDVIVFDLQDVGLRCYTYLSTLHYVMEAAAENGKSVVVLDRPNPNGYYIDGPVLDSGFSSFVGMHPVPLVYGMTIGEYARMINGEGWLSNGLKCVLDVIPLQHYNRDEIYTLPVKPSPNLPNQRAIMLYPTLVLFEGTTVSVGRGTEYPFQCFGHPEYALGSFSFMPRSMRSSSSPKWMDQTCFGANLSGLSPDDIIQWKKINLSFLIGTFDFLKKENEFFRADGYFDKLAGTDQLRISLQEGKTADEIRKSWQEGIDQFSKTREKYLMYPDFH